MLASLLLGFSFTISVLEKVEQWTYKRVMQAMKKLVVNCAV